MMLVQAAVADSMAGCIGGICKSAVLYPLDIATTRREVGLTAWDDKPYLDRHYRGLGVCVALAPFYAVLFHSAYVLCRNDVVGATMGSLVASIVGAPSECLKKRVQLGATPKEALRSGLYDGYGATLLRNVPYNAVNFGVFRLLRRFLQPPAAGFFAGAATAVMTHPIDVALTTIQTARLYKQRPDALLPTLFGIFRDGIFFRGLLVRLLNYAPASLLFFSVFDPVRTLLLSLLV